ncbi:consensus disorder prediction [Desulfoluna spongiiphila]|nr:consensus disorder prediction [Desulfoluna spongiiphila]
MAYTSLDQRVPKAETRSAAARRVSTSGRPNSFRSNGFPAAVVQRALRRKDYFGEQSWVNKIGMWKGGARELWEEIEELSEQIVDMETQDVTLIARRQALETHAIGFAEAPEYRDRYEELLQDLLIDEGFVAMKAKLAGDFTYAKLSGAEKILTDIEEDAVRDGVVWKLKSKTKIAKRIYRISTPEMRKYARPLARLLNLADIPAMIEQVSDPLDDIRGMHPGPDVDINDLFHGFCRYGFQYNSAQNFTPVMLGAPGERHEPEDHLAGNCVAMAYAFALLLGTYGIKAEAKYVHPEHTSAIILELPNFIDRSMRGNIRIQGKFQNYYLFTMHAATYIPHLNLYYDPMAGEVYSSLKRMLSRDFVFLDKDTLGDEIRCQFRGTKGALKVSGSVGGMSRWDFTPE